MPSLSETQAAFRRAVAGGAEPALLAGICCPAAAEERLAIYRRHYRESFRRHLRGRYPTLEWLLGTPRLTALADQTLAAAPPGAPSLAEYGAELITVLEEQGHDLPPYAADVARLDWSLGTLSVAIAEDPLALALIAAVPLDALPELRLVLQPGLFFCPFAWPVDQLFALSQRPDAPDELRFDPGETLLQLHGVRGRLSLKRLARGSFAFRAGLSSGLSLAAAVEAARQADAAFDLSAELAAFFAEDLVIHLKGPRDHA